MSVPSGDERLDREWHACGSMGSRRDRNGPQAIDAQARRLRSIVSERPAMSDARLSA
jgi:hypothetical protein